MRVPNAIGVRWRHPLLRPVRFGAVGAACSGVQLAVLLALVELGLRHDLANFIALLVSTQASFLLSAAFIWPDRPLAGRAPGSWLQRLLAFNLTSFATLLLNEGVYLLALQRVHYLVAALCGIAVAAPVNYLIEHYLVFRPRPAPGQGLGPV